MYIEIRKDLIEKYNIAKSFNNSIIDIKLLKRGEKMFIGFNLKEELYYKCFEIDTELFDMFLKIDFNDFELFKKVCIYFKIKEELKTI